MPLALCFVIMGAVMVICGVIRSAYHEGDVALPEIEPIPLDDDQQR